MRNRILYTFLLLASVFASWIVYASINGIFWHQFKSLDSLAQIGTSGISQTAPNFLNRCFAFVNTDIYNYSDSLDGILSHLHTLPFGLLVLFPSAQPLVNIAVLFIESFILFMAIFLALKISMASTLWFSVIGLDPRIQFEQGACSWIYKSKRVGTLSGIFVFPVLTAISWYVSYDRNQTGRLIFDSFAPRWWELILIYIGTALVVILIRLFILRITQRTLPPDLLELSRICHHCRYSLVGISPSSRCPECGRYQDVGDGKAGKRRFRGKRFVLWFVIAIFMGLSYAVSIIPMSTSGKRWTRLVDTPPLWLIKTKYWLCLRSDYDVQHPSLFLRSQNPVQVIFKGASMTIASYRGRMELKDGAQTIQFYAIRMGHKSIRIYPSVQTALSGTGEQHLPSEIYKLDHKPFWIFDIYESEDLWNVELNDVPIGIKTENSGLNSELVANFEAEVMESASAIGITITQ